jgi:hypothetical protein
MVACKPENRFRLLLATNFDVLRSECVCALVRSGLTRLLVLYECLDLTWSFLAPLFCRFIKVYNRDGVCLLRGTDLIVM